MRKVILFIAMSLDGYIADENGGVDWLRGQGDDQEVPDTYPSFIQNIDTVMMGWNTYHQVATELSPNEWVYKDLQSYVFTHRNQKDTENIKFLSEDPIQVVKDLKNEQGKDIWICGGASLVQQLEQENLIDQYYITIIPTLLGQGAQLFGKLPKPIDLRLIKSQNYDGITELIYERR